MTREALTLGRAISLWEGSLRAQVKADSTVAQYVRSVEYLEEEFGRDCDPASISIEDIETVMAKWRGRSPTTVRNRLVAMREFFKWGARRHGWPNPTEGLDIPPRDEPALRRLTVAEVTAMLDARVLERAHLYVHLLAYTAARIETLRHVRWQDVDLVEGRITFPHPNVKGRRGYEVPIAPQLVETLARSKDERGQFAYDQAYLIPARRRAQFIPEEEATLWDQPASQMSLGRMIKAVAEAAGVRAPQQVTAHMFRRYTLEHIVNAYGIYVGAALAGHRSIQTTARYAGRASREKVAEALRETVLRDTASRSTYESADLQDFGRTRYRTKAQSPQGSTPDGTSSGDDLVTPEDVS